MDLEEEIAMLKKENEDLKNENKDLKIVGMDNPLHPTWLQNKKLESELNKAALIMMEFERFINKEKEENKKLKKENEELKDGENTAKMIDKLNDEFSVLQDKNMKLEEEITKEVNEKEELEEKYEKLEEEVDETFSYCEYDEDWIRDGYTKLDAVVEYIGAREDQIYDLQSENRDLEEKNKELEKEIKQLKKEKDCSKEELETIEGLLRIFAKDNKLPDESLDCQGCRIRQIGAFIAFMIDNIRKESETVVQATPIK